MFEEKQDITEAVERLWSEFSTQPRGTSILWEDVERVMGRGRTEAGGWRIINRFRKRLLSEREIVTFPIHSVGIRLLTHQETSRESPAIRQRRAYRQINRSLKETATVDGTALSDHDRRVLAIQRHNLKYQRLQIGRSRRELEGEVKKTECNPIRRMPGITSQETEDR